MKRFLTIFLCVALVFASAPMAFAADTPAVSVYIDGQQVVYTSSSGQPFIDGNNRTQVPLRATMEAYGCSVGWNSYTRTVTVTYGSQTVQLTIGSNYMNIGRYTGQWLDTQPVIIGGRTYLPIRAVLEAFGATVGYDAATRSITAESPAYKTLHHSDGVKSVEYEWTDPYNSFWGTDWTYTAELDSAFYNYYRSIDRKSIRGYAAYAEDSLDDELISDLIQTFRDGAEDYTDDELVRLVMSFVQSFDYVSDESWTGTYDEYPKFPYETLYDHCGDCEDTSILLVTLLRELGYGACLIELSDHMAVGVAGEKDIPGWYFKSGGTYYYYIETTAEGWDIGEMPEEYQGSTADLLFID